MYIYTEYVHGYNDAMDHLQPRSRTHSYRLGYRDGVRERRAKLLEYREWLASIVVPHYTG